MNVSPEEKHRLLVDRWGQEETAKRIKELRENVSGTGPRAASTLRAVDILFQEAQWETVQSNALMRGFYLGSYRRGAPGFEQDETYVLMQGGPQRVWVDDVEMLGSLEDPTGKALLLAPIEIAGVSKVKNIGTQEERWRVSNGSAVKRINLPAQLLVEWANKLDEVVNEAKPAFVVEAISAVRDVVPAKGWRDLGDGKRERVDEVPPLPIITADGDINLKLTLSEVPPKASVSISDEDQLKQLLHIPEDTEDAQGWLNWIQSNALKDHDGVLKEIQALTGRQVVVFGSGGSEIQRKDPGTGRRETLVLSGSFITPTQIGFVMSFLNATKKIAELSQGEQVEKARPSAAAPVAAKAGEAPAVPAKGIKEAILDLVDAGEASKAAMKKLATQYRDPNEIVDTMLKLDKDGVIKFDASKGQYIRVPKKE